MANQPKKYTKFVATAATATLVASAIVPVASAAGFSDVANTNSHSENINALVEAGIIQGYPDGTFKPNQELTRGQVVKMLGKWVEAQGFDIPADYATKARFNDLAVNAKDQELVKYAALVADTGVFNGSNGALNAGGKITRENMALVLDRAYKAINKTTLVELAAEIEDVKVADLTTAKAEAREAIQALRDLGISVVENFNPKNTVTRGQFASFLNKTINTEAKEVELTVKEAVAVDATTLNVTLSDDTTHVVTLEKALEANVATEVTFKIKDKEYTATVTFKVEAPKVMSVNIVDGLTVEVKFSEAVLKSDINNKVSIQGTTLDTAALSEDGKTLTLNSPTAINVKDAALVVEPVRTAKDRLVKTAKYVSVVTYKDEVAPAIASVKAATKGKATETVTVTLTEAATADTAKINGQKATISKVEGKVITLTGVTVEAGKTHTVELFNVVDAAGNKTVKASKAFEVTVDTVAPTATIEAAGDNAILVTFDKPMNVASVEAALANGIIKDELLAAVTSDTAKVVANSNDKQFLVELKDNAIFANKDSRVFTVVLGGKMTDALGNKFAATTKTVTLTKDVAKPVATGYDIIVDEDGKVEEIVVEFNEALAAKSGINFGSIATVVNEEGKVDSKLNTLTGSVEKGSKKVSFKFGTPVLVEGKFAVTFNQNLVTDLALAANQSAAFNMTFDFGTAKTSTEFEMAANAVTTSGDTITVNFPTEVKGGAVAGSATDLANYTLDGKALTGATITISDNNKKATIKLAEGTITEDNNTAVLKVSNVQNLAGTKTVKAYEQTIAVQDTKAPELTSAVIIDNQTIELTYNEAVRLGGGTFASDFSLIVDGQAHSATLATPAAVVGKDNTLRVTLSAPINFALADTVNVKVIGNAAVTDKGARTNAQKLNIEVKAK